jgi:phospholipid/cholesterol/gamma-HCH transport system substrate-binding protein
MAKRNPAEIAAGVVVILIAASFLGYAVANSGRSTAGRFYPLHANFQSIDGLTIGSDVRIAGVKVGSVLASRVDPNSFQAAVTLQVADTIKLPKDSAAAVTSDGLLGGKYLALTAGGDEATIPPGGQITVTQSSVSLEELLGKFIFSVTDLNNSASKSGAKTP